MPNTMAFFIACSKSMAKRLHRWLLLLVFLPVLAWTAEIEVSNPQLLAVDEGLAVSADFRLELNPRLEEAVAKGVVLYFVAEFEINRPRWYWIDESLVTRSQTFSLSYHALTRQYRLSKGGLHQGFASLKEALTVLSRLRNWVVVERGDKSLRPGESVPAALRLRLDLNQLPRPFQISALGNKDWTLASDWKIWMATIPTPTLPLIPVGETK